MNHQTTVTTRKHPRHPKARETPILWIVVFGAALPLAGTVVGGCLFPWFLAFCVYTICGDLGGMLLWIAFSFICAIFGFALGLAVFFKLLLTDWE